ncbi:CDP-alcohol phosphatidyltransferase family protein [Candidatus Woesearchaeota archaeon]|nr:CDP-alcohol phosphatidyltransferase family protein [Candidatus Woesearchaeota archaeon]
MEKADNITYKAIRAKQAADLKSKSIRYMVYRRFSTPFTYAFVKLGMSPASVSILNFFVPLAGFYFLIQGSYASMIIGLFFFMLFKTLDCCDGEVARIQNPKAMDPMHRRLEGAYFDGLSNYIYAVFLGTGLGIGLSELYGSRLFISLGAVLAIFMALEVAIIDVMKSYFRRGLIERKLTKITDKYAMEKLIGKINSIGGGEVSMFKKLLWVYPTPGLLYATEFFAPVLIVITLAEYSMIKNFNVGFIFYQFSILALYLLIVTVVRAMNISIFVYKMKKHEYMTSLLEELQSKKL